MHKKVAVILSGCGVYDGAEIHESVLTLLRLDQRGAQVQCFAPNIAQMHVIDHLTGAGSANCGRGSARWHRAIRMPGVGRRCRPQAIPPCLSACSRIR